MKLEVGMYVRTKEGIIGKYNVIKEFENVPTFNGFYETKETERECLDDKPFRNYDIKKASFNLIDLIEIDDFVNGSKVFLIDGDMVITLNSAGSNDVGYKNNEIDEILTKEQYEANVYKLGE